jgi:abequosyltransferase
MLMSNPSITLGVPAYGRPKDLHDLLRSVLQQTETPNEFLLCEDGSPQRAEVRLVMEQYSVDLQAKGIKVIYRENPINLGYDGNVRNVIAQSNSEYVMLLGNDDVLLPDAIKSAKIFLNKTRINAVSRAFCRFSESPENVLGYSRFHDKEHVFQMGNSNAGIAFRLSAFFGGIIFNKKWADNLATDKYDGTLFYQSYLFFHAFLQSGIGYIHTPIVGARVGNPPLFGSAKSEESVHVQGRYTAASRADMWRSVIRIAADIGEIYKQDIEISVRRELEVRMSFHLFEMFASKPLFELRALRAELQALGLYDHPLPQAFYWVNRILGKHSKLVYFVARRLVQ